MNRTVLGLDVGEEAVVRDFHEANVACKLLTIGIVPDAKISLIRKAPFGGAVCLKLGDTFIAVRNNEAKTILVD